jgi:hypothetical protein
MNNPDDKYLIGTPEQTAPAESPAGVPPLKVEIRKGFDEKGRPRLNALTTLDEVEEEHVYLIYRSGLRDVVVECDLLGDQSVRNSDGKLPPVVHLECPRCTKFDEKGIRPEDSKRSIMSMEYRNKKFEIEDLPRKDWGVVTMPDGRPVMGSDGKPAIVTRRLTTKETFKCPFCGWRYKITDNILQDA